MDNSQQFKAAYALNLCTVSVSQIIDYQDLMVMEQEYESILNNINLEQIPKDEALLKILKEILDVITFFRIQEGDKKFIDIEYQQKMENAIWNAVPNIGLLVAGGDLVTMAISLASQIGIGYMNYRKEKASNQLEYERQLWELDSAAIEQFNGLRRELFDTAWRLADAYNFPDNYRLTETQIHQYNEILMDTDLIRRYERLESIKDSFIAYPLFWYFFGHTASEIAKSNMYALGAEDKEYYLDRAKECFQKFYGSRHFNLLRVNHLASACALEYAELLDSTADKQLIEELISYAVKKAGNANDILELCAMAYLKNGQYENASVLLNNLVNESYNTRVNAQMLSAVYARISRSGTQETQKDIQRKYNLLSERVNKQYLFPLPVNPLLSQPLSGDESAFIDNQKEIAKREFENVLSNYLDKYSFQFNSIFPLAKYNVDPEKDYYLYEEDNREKRLREAKKFLLNEDSQNDYKRWLGDIDVAGNIIELLNQVIDDLHDLSFISLEEHDQLWFALRNTLPKHEQRINRIIESSRSPKPFTFGSYCDMNELTLNSFTDEMFDVLRTYTDNYIDQIQTMADLSDFEYSLQTFCATQEIDPPQLLIDSPVSSELIVSSKHLSVEMLGKKAADVTEITRISASMANLIYREKNKLLLHNDGQVRVLTRNNSDFNRYFKEKGFDKGKRNYLEGALAVIDDKFAINQDLILTDQMIKIVSFNSISAAAPYYKVHISSDHKKLKIANKTFSNKNINIPALWNLINQLAEMSKPLSEIFHSVHSSPKNIIGSVGSSYRVKPTKKLYWTK